MSKLKGCPFCGRIPKISGNRRMGLKYTIECVNLDCDADVRTSYWDYKEDAIETWNRRNDE